MLVSLKLKDYPMPSFQNKTRRKNYLPCRLGTFQAILTFDLTHLQTDIDALTKEFFYILSRLVLALDQGDGKT